MIFARYPMKIKNAMTRTQECLAPLTAPLLAETRAALPEFPVSQQWHLVNAFLEMIDPSAPEWAAAPMTEAQTAAALTRAARTLNDLFSALPEAQRRELVAEFQAEIAMDRDEAAAPVESTCADEEREAVFNDLEKDWQTAEPFFPLED